MNNIIKVSVVMCTYNGEKYLREQIDSILNQTYPIYEIIIQDDCSTDNTWQIIQDYAKNYSIIKVYRNKTRINVYLNFFSAFHKANGDWIAVSDQDDVWLPEKIQVYIDNTNNSEALLLYSNSIITDESLNKTNILKQSSFLTLEDAMFGEKGLCGHTMFFKPELAKKINNWKEIIFAYDYVITITSLILKEAKHVNKALTYYRRHSSTVTQSTNIVLQKAKKVAPIKLTYLVFKYLAYKKRVPNFSWFYLNLNKILQNFMNDYNIDKYLKFTYYYAKENLIGIIKASYIWGSTTKGFIPRLKVMYRPIHYYYQCMTIYYDIFKTWQ